MLHPVRITDDLYLKAAQAAHEEQRTITAQINFWAQIGKTALENQDLTTDMVIKLVCQQRKK
jgi:hypothetical protein